MKPILFDTENVRALLEGRKTVTRRVVKPQPPATAHVSKTRNDYGWSFWEDNPEKHYMKPPYHAGDILWVRETFRQVRIKHPGRAVPDDYHEFEYEYKADGDLRNSDGTPIKWRSPYHMPREAARIFLRVTDVRVERLDDMTTDDVFMEGVSPSRKNGHENAGKNGMNR